MRISQAINEFVEIVRKARSENTAATYRTALKKFSEVLAEHQIDPERTETSDIPTESIAWLIEQMNDHEPTSERLYISALTRFFEYLNAEDLSPINMSKVRLIIKQRARRPRKRLPQFPRRAIEKVIEYAEKEMRVEEGMDEKEALRVLRDRAFIITLADTGLRVHEACKLTRGELDLDEGQALIVGKGDKQAVVRFSSRAIRAIRDYLRARRELDGKSGKPLASLPVFARHDRGAGSKIKPIGTNTGRELVAQRVKEALGDDELARITPHTFRHRFVTEVILKTNGNIKLGQELARHANIATTTLYTHLSDDDLDRGYYEVFEKDLDDD